MDGGAVGVIFCFILLHTMYIMLSKIIGKLIFDEQNHTLATVDQFAELLVAPDKHHVSLFYSEFTRCAHGQQDFGRNVAVRQIRQYGYFYLVT